ncbi:lymphatic vessel endothelial hyaluronic receptor 1b isoform X2 [Syngnathus acus]|uniref:lymphatic vessel endothelial hyaluronic receptor 1b isoform X2 n=1 Tax=Syngnathus acus TaxID=161584 RepID=UPI001885D7E1|nr:lymphatic vessel endothelial hyaluronic receptor 1b isoform X2 [Syngnathus acus]
MVVVVTGSNMLTCLLTLTLTSALLKVSKGQSAAGVFLLIEGGGYTFNFTAALAACHSRHATMATVANMEEALRHGLQTCKFGWVTEQVAVIPRLTASDRCGKGKTGLIRWNAGTDQAFAVFCINATATTPTSNSSTTSAPSPTTAVKTSPTSHQVPISTTTSPSLTHHPSSSSLASSAHALPSHVITSWPTSSSSRSSFTSTPTHASNQQTQRPVKAPLRVVWMVFIVLGIVFLMVTVAGVSCYYYKLKSGSCRSQVLQGDDVEAEMWKPTDSRTNLHRALNDYVEEEDEDEEQSNTKFSSDIMLCVNPQMRNITVS